MRIVKHKLNILVGAAALTALASDAGARDSRGGMHCEEWRDYHYNVETGAFIEWVGEPYVVCDFSPNTSRPDRPPRPGYDGGFGSPRDNNHDNRCRSCETQLQFCSDRALDYIGVCTQVQRNLWTRRCKKSLTTRYGTPIPSTTYQCSPIDPGNDRASHPISEVRCSGPGIDACVADYMESKPQITTTESYTVALDLSSIGVELGAGGTVQVQWGGSKGAAQACDELGTLAAQACTAEHQACTTAEGGCR